MTPVMLHFLAFLLLSSLLAAMPSCGPPTPAASGIDPRDEEEDSALLEALERRVDRSIARARESAVALEYVAADAPSGARRVATGVVLNDRGEVLSVRIDPPPAEAPIVARDASGRRHRARWVAADAETGLTLLRVDPKVAEPVRPASRSPRLGSQVLIVGNPYGLGHSVSRGQVAGLDRRLEIGPRPLGGLIQIDAALHPGDSGASVTNLRGEWLGLVRGGLNTPEGGRPTDHDLGFVIPARDALWVADQLRDRHRVDRAYLGVRLDAIGKGKDNPPGAVLDTVVPDTPAARAGLRPGDRVVALDGHAIHLPGDLTDRLDRIPAEAEVTLDYFRGTSREHLALRTGSRPPISPAPSNPAPKGDDARAALALSREAVERLDRLEHRVQELEKQVRAAPKP